MCASINYTVLKDSKGNAGKSKDNGIFSGNGDKEGEGLLVEHAVLKQEGFCAKCDSTFSYGSSTNEINI